MAKAKTPGPVGQRLKALRHERGWTLSYVSSQTGISLSTLSKLENGVTNLTFTTVNKLAGGLGIPISTLTNPHTPNLSARRSMTRLGGGTLFQAKDADYEILCNDLADKNQAYLRISVKCHSADEQPKWRRHPGQEFLYVLSGTLELHTEAYDPVILKTGDSIVFDSSMGHKYVSKGKKNTEILVTMSLAGYTDIEETLEELNN